MRNIFSDEPSKSDFLGAEAYVLALVRFIENISGDFFSIGVIGEWGTGKTTILELIRKKLNDRKPRYLHVAFSPWKYARKTDMTYTFFKLLARELIRRRGRWEIMRMRFGISFRIAIRWLITGVFWLILKVLKVSLFAKLSTFNADITDKVDEIKIYAVKDEVYKLYQSLLKGHETGKYQEISSSQDIKDRIDDLIALCVKRHEKIVIYVDDLDRCSSDMVKDTLDSVKLFLGRPGCVFVIAFDDEVVRNAIRTELSDMDVGSDSVNYANMYLDKIIHLSIPISGVGEFQIRNFRKGLIRGEEGAGVLKGFGLILENVESVKSIEAGERFLNDHLWKIPVKNPRAIKKIMNLFNFEIIYHDIIEYFGLVSEIDYDLLLKAVLLKLYIPRKILSSLSTESFVEILNAPSTINEGVLDGQANRIFSPDSFQKGILEFCFPFNKKNPNLGDLEKFVEKIRGYLSHKRTNSIDIADFHNLVLAIGEHDSVSDSEIRGGLVKYLKDFSKPHLSKEHQLAYLKIIQEIKAFPRFMLRAKSENFDDYAFISSLIICYADGKSELLDGNPQKKRAISRVVNFLFQFLSQDDLVHFKSKHPMGRLALMLIASGRIRELKDLVLIILREDDLQLKDFLSFFDEKRVRVPEVLCTLMLKLARGKPSKILIINNWTRKHMGLRASGYWRRIPSTVEQKIQRLAWIDDIDWDFP